MQKLYIIVRLQLIQPVLNASVLDVIVKGKNEKESAPESRGELFQQLSEFCWAKRVKTALEIKLLNQNYLSIQKISKNRK